LDLDLQRQVGDVDGQMPIASPSEIFALESTGNFLRFREVDGFSNYRRRLVEQLLERERLCPPQPLLCYTVNAVPASNN
jgi:hypothetical protein